MPAWVHVEVRAPTLRITRLNARGLDCLLPPTHPGFTIFADLCLRTDGHTHAHSQGILVQLRQMQGALAETEEAIVRTEIETSTDHSRMARASLMMMTIF